MVRRDSEILDRILKTEGDFAQKIACLADLLEGEDLSGGLSDYLSGLSDLKYDFLLPALEQIPVENENAADLLADRYWYYQRI